MSARSRSISERADCAEPVSAGIPVAGPDQSVERSLVSSFDPVATVYLDLDIQGEDERELRWTKLAESLRAQGASGTAVAAIAARVETAPQAPVTLAVFAQAGGMLLHEQRLSGVRMDSVATWVAPPRTVPLLAWAQDRPPYVLAVVDRAGADLSAGLGGPRPARRWTVTGSDDEIERNAPGGWSQPRYQRRAEDSWRHNAGQVAAEVLRRAEEVHAQVLVVSGDVRATQLLIERLPASSGLLVQHLNGSRARDGSQSRRAHELELALRQAARVQTAQLLSHVRTSSEPGGLAVQGRAATLDALAVGRVALLLVVDEPADERTAWFGAGATDIFADHDVAVRSGKPVRRGRLVDVAVRAALMSGARVRVIEPGTPDAPAEQIGALCRFAAGAVQPAG